MTHYQENIRNGQVGSTRNSSHQGAPESTHYALLGLTPWASSDQIRRAYRELSKRYHPDTTTLPPEIARQRFHELNQAYALLMNPEQREIYDRQIGYSQISVLQAPTSWSDALYSRMYDASRAMYLDPTDRPLSPGEIFAVFLLGLTFVGCLVLAIAIGITRGDIGLQVSAQPPQTSQTQAPPPTIPLSDTMPPSQPNIIPHLDFAPTNPDISSVPSPAGDDL